ncbi:hypothetical protein SPAB_01584 [Salmonella enterica subsp. enterica serovar Paratyphi B str. SPB7]|uniref:Uncharacterized protein n=1 Tax=Salmonella paratyphi B (strain ATCC BAA-1250 / SPB7) TaxID=1016998 RepID=A0A6C6Z1G8_SALPB|nr:hypothetical protein SPAB_01584 [Salmonella enterica subsp. enterica serovar Paratyphi B str. SPB7]
MSIVKSDYIYTKSSLITVVQIFYCIQTFRACYILAV